MEIKVDIRAKFDDGYVYEKHFIGECKYCLDILSKIINKSIDDLESKYIEEMINNA